MSLDFILVPCLSDNYAVIARDRSTDNCAIIDAPEAGPIIHTMSSHGIRPTHLFITHHHHDHTQGIAKLKSAFGLNVIAPAAERGKIPHVDIAVSEGSEIIFAGRKIEAIETPGHTNGHISYHWQSEKAVFTGDTLFVMGCGRLLEGSAEIMWASLQKLSLLPPDTRVFCGHEYALGNAKFALSVESANQSVLARAGEIESLRKADKPVMPSTIALERTTNPFLLAKGVEEFGKRRALKDRF